MVKSKTVNLICCICLGVMLILAVVVWVSKAAEGRQKTVEMGYESLFDKSYVHTIDIEIDNWTTFIDTATGEEYVSCNVTIDGEKVKNVGLRAKGNTSLSSVATMGSEKYSFKIEFDHFDDNTLYKGLDKLSLNNLIYDSTMMKDYLAYTLMGEMDVPSPLCSYVEITVNGESWGLYLAVEGVEESFMQRNNMTRGELYKPDSLSFGGGRGNGMDFDMDQFRVDDEESSTYVQSSMPNSMPTDMSGMPTGGMSFPGGDFSGFSGGGMPSGGSMPGNMPSSGMPSGGSMPTSGMSMGDFSGMTPPSGDFSSMDFSSMDFSAFGSSDSEGRGGFSIAGFAGNFNFGMGSSDVKLQYIDDDFDSYSNIFNNAKIKVSRTDKQRLINSLKKLSSGEDIGSVVYTDEVISYLAVHDFLQNSDSYTGMMVHNYYLYEENGQLAIIPWDYNLAFGGMNGSDGTSLVNSPIDTPVTSGSTSDRPLIGWIFEDEDALNQYHETYSYFVSEYIESGWLSDEISRVYEMIRPYVESDENSFYSAEEFDEAIETLQAYCSLRGESIRGQLEGTIPSTSNGQRNASASLVNASGLDVSSMGSMGGTRGGGFGGGFDGGFNAGDSSSSGESSRSSFGGSPGGGFSGGERPSDTSSGRSFSNRGSSEKTSSERTTTERPASQGSSETTSQRMMPSSSDFSKEFSMPQGMRGTVSNNKAWIQVGIYALILLAAIGLVLLVRRRNE